MIKMSWDTDEYLDALRTHKRAMGFHTLRDAEVSLFPIRAAKRQIKRQERIELQSTVRRRNESRG